MSELVIVQSKKKGLSVDEKKVKVLEIFHESRDVFQLKVGLGQRLPPVPALQTGTDKQPRTRTSRR